MTRYIAFVVFMLASLVATAQSRISVKEETYDDMETTAMVNPEKDRNNRDCALVIFHNVEPDGYYFDAGSVFIKAQNHVSRETGEKTIFLYISEGAKVINLRHRDDGIMSLRYEFANGPLEGRHTYHVFLGKVVPANANAKQYLRFHLTPPTASVEVEEQPGQFVPWAVDASGNAAKLLPLGDYAYTVKAKQYHSTAGKVSMVDATKACDETVTLKPAFGILEIASVADGTVSIDGENIADYKNLRLDPGEYTVKISRPKYKLYQKTVQITEGNKTVLTPDFEANFGSVVLRASAPDVTISLQEAASNRVLGTGSWQGDLDAGTYTVISSAPGHRESVHTITVAPGSGNLSFNLPAPTPIYGSVNVASSPMGAQIKIDGKTEGVTPLLVSNVLVGKHTVELLAAGKQSFTASVDVRENEIAELNAELKQAAEGSSTPQQPTAEALHRDLTFEELPDFITHPLGYNGGWDFNKEKDTKKTVLNYFRGLDSSLTNFSKDLWEFKSSKSHIQSIVGYDFEFFFIRSSKKSLCIWYKITDKEAFDAVNNALSPLWGGKKAYAINGIGGHVNFSFIPHENYLSFCVEYIFI